MPEYQTFAWQEAIVNAVAHRDYAIQVRRWRYGEDRLEVLSPGGLLPEIAIDDLRLGHPAHASRNSSIDSVRLLTPFELLEIRMREIGFITNADYREAVGVDRFAATAELAEWVAEGVLVREGERRGTRYRPGPGWPPV